jgi:surface carbohydrate biosynthesis protein (TIGR04326 family)
MIKPKFHPDYPLVILDEGKSWEGEEVNIIYWADIGSRDDCLYIPLLVDQYGGDLRAKYIELIDCFGRSEINGESLRESLKQKEGFSFWWMTLLSEKSPWKSGEIYTSFRALMLNQLIQYYQGGKVIVISDNKKLFRWISAQSSTAGKDIEFVAARFSKGIMRLSLKRLLPHTLLAFMYFIKMIVTCRAVLFDFKRIQPSSDPQARIITLIGYSDSLEFKDGRVFSGYWGKLGEHLLSHDVQVQWLMLYVPSRGFPSLKSAIKARDNNFNDTAQKVLFVEEFITFRVLRKALLRYFKLRHSTSKYYSLMDDKSSVLSFLAKDWASSTKGLAAIDACIKYSLLEETLNNLPITGNSGKGVYLYENQAWERALTYLWKQVSKQELFGFQHVSGKFYDLRPFDGFGKKGKLTYDEAPLPDKVVVTGSAAARDMFLAQYPEERIVVAESLRNLYLNDLVKRSRADKVLKDSGTLLVVTDYLESVTDYQLKILAESWDCVDSRFSKVIVKPHPNCPIDSILKKYAIENKTIIEVEECPLNQLWSSVDVVYASNVTGAALESAYINIPTVVSLSGGSFNMSPLRGVEGVIFVATARDFKASLACLTLPKIPNDYLCLDSDLKKWDALLEN